MATRQLSTKKIVNLSSNPDSASAGEIYYNTSSNSFKYYNGTSWVDLSSGGGTASDSFTTINVPNGTDPVADSSTDTLNITESNGIIITGDSSTDTINISTNATSSNTASTIVSRDADQAFDITGVDFDTTDSIASAVGRLNWDSGEGTLSLGLKGGNINLSLGQENVALCYNGTGSTLNKGSVVYISGAQGQKPSITLSDADTETASSKTFGVVAENILNGEEGFVCTFGIITGIDTSSFTAGQALWLSSNAGQLTNVIPTQPAHSVFIGYCLHSNASSGRIFVNPQNGYELQELHNVLINSLADNHILSYDNATSLWKNQSLVSAIQEIDGASSGIDSDLLDGQHGSYYAPINSPTLTGTPAAPTANVGTNTTQIATTAYVRGEISALVASAPSTLDTLNELALALGNDPNYATTISTALGGKEPTITSGTTSQYWRGDKSWQTLDKTSVGLSNVENTALSTWSGSTNITTLGTIGSGTWQGSEISTTYTAAKVTSVNGSAGAVTGLAIAAGKLSQFASTTSSELAGVISDETGTGSLVFGTSPAITTSITTPSTSFDLINTTATTINFASAATTLNIGGASTRLVLTAGSVLEAPVSRNVQTASYPLVLSDAGKLIEMNVSSANDITIPLNSTAAFPIGTKIDILQTGSGQTTILATSGVTLNSAGGRVKLTEQWSAATLIKRDTNTWVLIGDLSA